jgi:hypothetical protein
MQVTGWTRKVSSTSPRLHAAMAPPGAECAPPSAADHFPFVENRGQPDRCPLFVNTIQLGRSR